MQQTVIHLTRSAKKYVDRDGLSLFYFNQISDALANISPQNIVETFLDIKGGQWGGTVLHYAAVNGHIKLIEKIFANLSEAERFELLSSTNKDSANVLQEAAGHSQAHTLRFILDSVPNFCSSKLIEHRTSFNYTTVHRASFSVTGNYDVRVLEILLNHAPETKWLLFERTNDGSTAIHESVYYQELTAVQVILSRLPTTTEKMRIMSIQANNGYTVLHTAARYSNADIIQALLDPLPVTSRVRLLTECANDGRNPLKIALKYNESRKHRDRVVEILRFYSCTAASLKEEARNTRNEGNFHVGRIQNLCTKRICNYSQLIDIFLQFNYVR